MGSFKGSDKVPALPNFSLNNVNLVMVGIGWRFLVISLTQSPDRMVNIPENYYCVTTGRQFALT